MASGVPVKVPFEAVSFRSVKSPGALLSPLSSIDFTCRKVDNIRLHGKGDSNSHGARPVYSHHLDDEFGPVGKLPWRKAGLLEPSR